MKRSIEKKNVIQNRRLKIERNRRRQKRRSKFLNRTKNNYRSSQVLPKNYYKKASRNFESGRVRQKVLFAPIKLSLQIGDSEKVLRFIDSLKNYGTKYNHIHLNLDDVQLIGEGVIGMLLSVINELTAKKVAISGTKPKSTIPRTMLEKSGFFKYMRGSVSTENLNTKNIIIRTGDINTSKQELLPEMPKAMETVWGSRSRCPELFGVIGEMLRNSCDHAFKNDHKIIWHLGVSHNEEENTVKFSFVDNGIGIIKTYNNRSNWAKLKSLIKNDAILLESAYKRGIESQTGLPWRGEGLPTIYELYEDNIITNLVVITNNVYLDFDNSKFEEIKYPFSGTYYFWQINKSCKPAYFV
ncbi:hypothetical protein [Gelidibacter japonicus]|uniref:hypothetical protein n=1 Tax=Gelidibacter japonicus TaxID=1962232 RepID=UPI003A93B6E0